MPTAIETRGLQKTYYTGTQEVPVLRGIDLRIDRGEFVSIMGPSGSGKSTLLNMVGLLDTPTAGHIRLLGRDVSDLSRNERAKARQDSMGFVFQAFHLQARATAAQNVMLPMALAGVPRSERPDRAARLLEQVGLGDRIKHKPSELSGGQKQRVAIARSLALDPPILFADEPTGNLDSETSADVMSLFRRLHGRGKTIIQVTHDPEMARFGGRVLEFKDGRIVRDGASGGLARGPSPTAAPPARARAPPATPATPPAPSSPRPIDGKYPARSVKRAGGR